MTNVDAIAATLTRLCGPLLLTLGVSALLLSPAGSGVGLVAGLCLALAAAMHALAFGVSASRRAFPPMVLRVALCLGLLLVVAGVLPTPIPWAERLVEAGLFVQTSAGAILALMALFGRAAALRDDAW